MIFGAVLYQKVWILRTKWAITDWTVLDGQIEFVIFAVKIRNEIGLLLKYRLKKGFRLFE